MSGKQSSGYFSTSLSEFIGRITGRHAAEQDKAFEKMIENKTANDLNDYLYGCYATMYEQNADFPPEHKNYYLDKVSKILNSTKSTFAKDGHKDRMSNLALAVAIGDAKIVEQIIKHGDDVSFRPEGQTSTPLDIALLFYSKCNLTNQEGLNKKRSLATITTKLLESGATTQLQQSEELLRQFHTDRNTELNATGLRTSPQRRGVPKLNLDFSGPAVRFSEINEIFQISPRISPRKSSRDDMDSAGSYNKTTGSNTQLTSRPTEVEPPSNAALAQPQTPPEERDTNTTPPPPIQDEEKPKQSATEFLAQQFKLLKLEEEAAALLNQENLTNNHQTPRELRHSRRKLIAASRNNSSSNLGKGSGGGR